MKIFFSRLIAHFFAVSLIDVFVNLAFYQSIETTILVGDLRFIVITFIVVFIGTIIVSFTDKKESVG